MTKFKVGDGVRWTRHGDSNWQNCLIEEVRVSGDLVVRNSQGISGIIHTSMAELITPTTFEVGKKYRLKTTPGAAIIVEYILSNGHAVGVDQRGCSRILRYFKNYIEVKPEDWRCLHYVNSIASLGGESFSSKEEVEKKFSSSPNFIKAVRVDA
jgi:hypothetical protein